MFGFGINSNVIDVLTDETYVNMIVAQYNLINGGMFRRNRYPLPAGSDFFTTGR